jgi:hypothetical protein
MRKFTCAALLLILAASCKKSSTPPEASASFQRIINGTDFYSYDFSNATSAVLSFTQTYYTGSLTGGKQTRWTLRLVDDIDPVNFSFSFPGIDSSLTLPTNQEMIFGYPASPIVACSLDELGTLYDGSTGASIDITILSVANNLLTGTFTVQMAGGSGSCAINNGHFANIPILYTKQ